jgi:hypothetical protein
MPYTQRQLDHLREQIECFTKFNQIEVLRILSKNDVTINENKYGIHINLSELDDSIIEELYTYTNYVMRQEITLEEVEKQKEEYKNTYFGKDNKDIVQSNSSKKSINAAIV